MSEYHKIQTVFKRDPDTNFKTLLKGDWSTPEFEYLADSEWAFTEKVDGTNIRVMLSGYQEDGKAYGVTFGGRTDRAQLQATLVSRLEERFHNDTNRALLGEIFPDGGCLYGEGYGAKIQKGGGNYRPDQDFVLFDVKVGDFWLQRRDVEDVARRLGLDVVPVIGFGTLHEMIDQAASGIRSTWGDFDAEGIVARPTTELMTRAGKRIITKIKCKDFPAIGEKAA